MQRVVYQSLLLLACLPLVVGCADQGGSAGNGHANGNGNGHANGKPVMRVVKIEVGPDAQEAALEAFIGAKDGDTIEFGEGTFELDTTLSLEDVKDVTVRGAGREKTILNFAKMKQGVGGEGMKLTGTKAPEQTPVGQANVAPEVAAQPAQDVQLPDDDGVIDNFTIADLTIQDPPSDGIKVEGARLVKFLNVKAEWTKPANPENGAYGLYPVLSKDVLIDGCVAIGSSDAGIYVGQSENIIVRNSEAIGNVAGIEIENSIGADVYNCSSHGNTGGLLVFSLPGLPKKNGRHCRIFDNKVYGNNIENFAKPGNIVATIPPGTGMIVMANDEVEVFNNTFEDNSSFNLTVISYLTTQKTYNDPAYDPYPESIYVHDNSFKGGGDKPAGPIGELAGSAFGGKVPDITFDGVIDEKKAQEGDLPKELKVFVKNNGDADFANLDLSAFLKNSGVPSPNNDLAPFDGEHAPLSKIVIDGVE